MKNKILLLTVCGLVLAACADQDLVQQETGSGEAIELRAEISQQYTTRANDGGFADGDQIGVYIVNYKVSPDPSQGGEMLPDALKPTGNHADNVRFTYDEATGKWTGSYQIYWKDKTTPIDAYGYYPFDAELSSALAYPFSVQQNQRDPMKTGRKLSGYEQSDFLWAKKEGVLPTAGVITLQHHHLMSGIKVILTEGEWFDDGEWNNLEKTVLVENTITESTINLQTGTVDVLSGSSVKTITPLALGRGVGGEASFRAIVIPQTVAAENNLFSITVGGKSYQFKRQESMVYYPGKLHQFTFEVQKTLETGDYQLSLISESVTAWDNDPDSHNGKAREYVTVHVEEGQFLGDVIEQMGLDPKKIVNLKLTGCISDYIGGYIGDEPLYQPGANSFYYIRDNMTNLEALNIKELRTKNMSACDWSHDSGEAYGMPRNADDYIPCYAFENMSSLRFFVFPDHLKGIGEMAFPGTALCGSIILPDGVVYIGMEAFVAYNHNPKMSLTGELYIPSTVEYIGDYAFGTDDGRKPFFFTNELVLPAKMKYLGKDAFRGCPYMTGTIRVPDGLDKFNNAWPDQISGPCLIPQGVKSINDIPGGATYVSIPEGVEEIYGFGGSKIKGDLRLPATVKTISRNAFSRCGMSHINIPEGIEIIEEWTFAYCENLQDTITIPSTVKQIREDAFRNCSQLTAVIFPAGLQGIKEEAFADCFSLDYIQCLGNEPPVIESNTFSGVEKDNFTVVVPEGAVEVYKNAPHWCEFKRISSYRNFVCRPMRAKLLNKSNVRDVVLNANDTWSVSDCPSWIHVSPTSGYKKTELKVTIDSMPHGDEDREGTVTFLLGRNDEDGHPITCTYMVKQFDYEYEEDAVIPMQKATKGQRGGIDIVFVGEGYDAEDIARGVYRSDMEQEMEYFFGVEPYKTYKDYFNVSVAVAMSYESGVVDSPDKWRNTKFGVTWGSGNNGRLGVPFEEIGGYVLNDVTDSPITAANVSRSLIICVPNSDAYEGLTALYSDGSAIAVCPMSKLDYPNDARGLIQHEAGGHGWGKLDDEYIYHRDYIQLCPCVCCTHVDGVESMHAMGWGLNLSLTGKYGQVPWKHLIAHEKYSDIVDIYEGGHMHAQGIFRSEVNSCMNNNVPYFSTWSRQLIVERILWAAGETFTFEDFVTKDSREYGDKFLTRGALYQPWQKLHAIHSENHGPVIKNKPLINYIKKGGKR